ncbi:MAG TPA: isoprenylcysteine carboxylmethyltransferase family protein [Acidimicrobiia bacterium]|nr:isoprenylcysteine carboxylmethyltransferase family protein [Acidimicrobiia bacterium]
MKRISDFLILGIQIALGYILVHFASPWTGNISLRIASFAILIAGVVIGVKALIDLGNSFAVAPAPHEKSHFIAKGIYSKVRHPMYLAVLLAATAYLILGFNTASLLTYISIAIFFSVKIIYEDKALKAKYPDYAEYARRTGALLPNFKS